MKIRTIIFSVLALCTLAACSGMNDNIDQYLSQGEIIYIAKPDSVHLYAGKDRFKLEFWLRDPRATGLTVYWAQRSSSYYVDLPAPRDMEEPVVVFVDKDIPEGQHALILVSQDDKGNFSIPDEENVSVYGELFQSTLINRLVDSYSVSGNKLTINWGNCYSAQEVGIQVDYAGTDGAPRSMFYRTAEMGSTTTIPDVDASKEVSYVTLYLPEPTAIDTFATPKTILSF